MRKTGAARIRENNMHEKDSKKDSRAFPGAFAVWADCIRKLCSCLDVLIPIAEAMGVEDPHQTDWHGVLFGKLRPQLDHEPVLVVAVCGGTNTGKSLIANILAGSEISRSVPEAARTRHPVASVPKGAVERLDLAKLFPGFTVRQWTNEDAALDPTETDILIWREDVSGTQPSEVVLLDTPDIDGTLQSNWHRAELIQNACDIVVVVLTQQKYNDATIRDFFRAAALAKKTMIIVFNMVEWPAQRHTIAGWLKTFEAETDANPMAVYAVPFDRPAADAGNLQFHELAEYSPDTTEIEIRKRLLGSSFDQIKRNAMEGAFRVVVDPNTGLSAWLDHFEQVAMQWKEAQDLLSHEGQVCVEMPTPPREIVWNEIWEWLKPRRSGFDLTVSRAYHLAGTGIKWAARRVGITRSEKQRKKDYAAAELAALKRAMSDFIEKLDETCRVNSRLNQVLGSRLLSSDRTAWYADLEQRHAALPIITDDYRTFAREKLDAFAKDNPDMVAWILAGLNVGAVARPAITVGLAMAGAAAVPAAAATAGGLTTFVHHVGDVVVGGAATVAGEGALGMTVAGLRPLIESLFAGWSAERSRVLAETLHNVVLGDRLDEIDRLAAVGECPDFTQAREILEQCERELSQ